MASPEELAAALMRAPAREAKVLTERLLVPRTRAEAAAYWGVPIPSADVMLLRAARVLETARSGAAPSPPLEFGLEASQAQALAEALDGAPPAPELAALCAVLQSIHEQRVPVAQHLRRLQELEEHSPRRRAETWARRGAILLVLGLSAYFLRREQNKPRFEPRPAPREQHR